MALIASFTRPTLTRDLHQSAIARLVETLLLEALLLEQGYPVKMADLPAEWAKAAAVLEEGATAAERAAARRWATEILEAFIGRETDAKH